MLHSWFYLFWAMAVISTFTWAERLPEAIVIKALQDNDTNTLSLAKESGWNVNGRLGKDSTFAILAVIYSKLVTLEHLAKLGATNWDQPGSYLNINETCLMKTCKLGQLDKTRFLLSQGADVTVTNTFGWNGLHYATRYLQLPTIEYLLSSHPKLKESTTGDGWTSLHIACERGYLSVVEKLLEFNVSTSCLTRRGFTAEALAKRGEYEAITSLLTKKTQPSEFKRPALRSGTNFESGKSWSLSLLTNQRQEIQIQNGPFNLRVLPQQGGMVSKATYQGNDLFSPIEDKDLLNLAPSGGIPLLFPVPNIVDEGQLVMNGNTYLLKSESDEKPIARHGYAHTQTWKWLEPKNFPKFIRLTMICDHPKTEVTFGAFPFKNRLTIFYDVFPNALKITYIVTNMDTTPFTFGFGLHAYFPPLKNHLSKSISGNLDQLLETDNFIPTQNVLSTNLFTKGLALNELLGTNLFFSQSKGEALNLKLAYDAKSQIEMTTSKEFGYLVTLASSPTKNFALEPQTSSPDAHHSVAKGFPELANLISLAPNESHQGWVLYTTTTLKN